MFSLAAWIVMVFHAASHPQWRDRSTAVPQNMQPRQIQRVPAVTPGSRTPCLRAAAEETMTGPPGAAPGRNPTQITQLVNESNKENDMDTHGQGLASAREEPFP
jgi:hypothetical protein